MERPASIVCAPHMSHSLIINARRELGWHRRLFSDATTAMLWGFWLWLWRPVLSAISWLAGPRLGLQHSVAKALALIVPTSSVANTAVALFGTSGSLLLWKLFSARSAPKPLSPELPDLPDYARHFGLSEREVAGGRAQQICTVHHDEFGRILRIDGQAA
jgi:poly-beta-1,6-N-acetyl-D-glucosamine biosynthesis protein PgaD